MTGFAKGVFHTHLNCQLLIIHNLRLTNAINFEFGWHAGSTNWLEKASALSIF